MSNMDDEFKSRLSANGYKYKRSLERIIEKYSKLQYQDGGVEVNLDTTSLQALERHIRQSKAEISKLESKSLNNVREESMRDVSCATALDAARDSQLDFTNEDHERSETRPSAEDDASCRINSTVTSSEESLRNVSAVEVQPEDRDEDLELSLRSHGSSLVELYPDMIGRIGRAWRRRHVSEAAGSVLRRYRRWRRRTGRSGGLGDNTFIVAVRCAGGNPENNTEEDEEEDTRNSPVKRQFIRAETDPQSPFRTLNRVQQQQGSPLRTLNRVQQQQSPFRTLNHVQQQQQESPFRTLNHVQQQQGSPLRTLNRVQQQQGSPLRTLNRVQQQQSPFRTLNHVQQQQQQSPFRTLNHVQQESPLRSLNHVQQQSPFRTLNHVQQQQQSPFRTLNHVQQESPLRSLNHVQQQSPFRTLNHVQQQESLLKTLNHVQQQQSPFRTLNHVQQQESPLKTLNHVQQQESPFRTLNNVQQQSPLRTLNRVQQQSPQRLCWDQPRPVLVMDLSDPSETFGVSEASRLGDRPSSCAVSPSRPRRPAAAYAAETAKERLAVYGSPVRKMMMMMETSLSRSPQGFPRSPKTYSGESFSREPWRPRITPTALHNPAVPLRTLHLQDGHPSLRPQLRSPQSPAAPSGRRPGLRRHLSFDSSLPSIRVSDSPKKLDEDFLKLYHKFVCQSKSSFFNRHPCRLCASRGPFFSSSSSSLAALSLSPHRSLLRKRHRELDRDDPPRSKRHRDECSLSSPGSQRHGKEVLRRLLSPPAECGLSHGAAFQRFDPRHRAADQDAWMSRRRHVSAADCSGTGSSLSRRFSPRKW
ncbi:putative uncharacterized protein DDB_G0291608 [Clinocottus analis]|uniref:putative uncharacterized protein DDB_G0291608 n=1 Tax=Clinocottus analis TaxID=304258 RepID=UPI0035C1A9B2